MHAQTNDPMIHLQRCILHHVDESKGLNGAQVGNDSFAYEALIGWLTTNVHAQRMDRMVHTPQCTLKSVDESKEWEGAQSVKLSVRGVLW